MKTKRMAAMFLAFGMAFSMVSCGSSGDTTTAAAGTTAAGTTAAATTAADGTTAAEGATSAAGSEAAGAGNVEITSTDKVTIIWSHNAPESSNGHQTALKFKELVEERSNGNITVEVHPNGELGTVPENDQALRDGTIQMNSGTSGGLVDMSLSYFDAPNMVADEAAAMELFGRGTEMRQETEKRYEALGMKVLSFVPVGFRVTSSNKEIRSYDDLKGLKIRTLENPVPIAYWQAWGCSPTPIAFSELYIALQQGLVEAEENTYDTIVSSKLYEQQKYIVNTNHVVMWGGMYMNLDFWNSLPADYQALIEDICANEIDDYQFNVAKEANEAAIQTMKDAGLEIIDLPEADLVKMREEAKPAYDMIRESVGDELMDKLEAALAK
jgi:tripartite ATP-independent transporter DctP family solute receptor